jgi:hypothetical protein
MNTSRRKIAVMDNDGNVVHVETKGGSTSGSEVLQEQKISGESDVDLMPTHRSRAKLTQEPEQLHTTLAVNPFAA